MMMGEYGLGATMGALPIPPAQDPVLAWASQTAREILADVDKEFPLPDRVRGLRAMLRRESPALGRKFDRIFRKLRGRGVKPPDALYTALRLAIADYMIDFFVAEGQRYSRGEVYGLGGFKSAMGKFGRFMGRGIQGAACAGGSEDIVTQLASRRGEQAAQYAYTGLQAFRSGVQCQPGMIPPGEGLPVTPEQPPIPWVPIAIGGVAILGLAAFVAASRR